MKRSRIGLVPVIACAVAVMSGCTTEIDEDAFRAGAIQMELGDVTTDELYPTAGDEIDWKMVFLPSPGDIIVDTYWDAALEIFNVEVGVYDRFGIPIKKQARETGGGTGVLRTFVPESGLHYVKLSAESGRSIYSVSIKFEENPDGEYATPTAVPMFDAYLDFDSAVEDAAKVDLSGMGSKSSGSGSRSGSGSGSSSGGGTGTSSGASSDGGNDGGAGAPAGAVLLPTAAAGGTVLPTAAAGGISSSSNEAGPTVVKARSVGGGFKASEVKTVDNKTSAAATTKDAIKPICSDIKGRFKSIDADVTGVTSRNNSTQIKLNVGSKHGVQDGAVGDIYVDGKILEGGRFKVEKIFETSCIAVTNASAADVKKAKRFVVKSPE